MNKSKQPPSVWQNPVKTKLDRGEPVVGAVITTNNVEAAVLLAGSGFDFLWVEMEHSAVSLETLRNIVLATRGLRAVPIARPPVNELWTAKRILDMGALGVIFPFTRTPELARQAVMACRYPPFGLRGSGASLATASWPVAGNYYDSADQNVLIIAMVEDECGVDNIDEIAAAPGLDVIFIGTSDLSFSLGLRGRQNHPKLEKAVAKIVAAAKKHGKILGRPALSPEAIRDYQKQGFLFFMTKTELELMSDGARQLLGPQ